jgi:hypothetical protein
MTKPSLTEEQEGKLTEALDMAKLLEEKTKEMSEQATAIADKYYKRLSETVQKAEPKPGN